MNASFQVFPIGRIRKRAHRVCIDIDPAYTDALLGLDGFSHIHVLYWFHENDTPENRRVLQVQPKTDPSNPLTGVFATHSPRRPNLIALSRCRIRSIDDRCIELDAIDARDGSPVLDIKCYIPDAQPPTGVRVPDWALRERDPSCNAD